MSQSVVSVTRHKDLGLVASRTKSAPGSSPDSHKAKTPARSVVPVLFDRLPSLTVKEAPPKPWWYNTKLLIALAITLCTAAVVVVYLLISDIKNTKNAKIDDSIVDSLSQRPIEAPTVIQIRPMKSAPMFRSPAGVSQGSNAGPPSGSSGSGSGTTTTDDELAIFDGNHKIVLPEDVSGSCDIGKSISKDFKGCLIRNGAHAE